MTTPNLGIITPVESQAQKTVTIANALTDLDKATQGDTPLVITGATTVTADEFTLGFSLELTGTPGAPFDLTVPATRRLFRVLNSTDDIATVKTAGSGSTIDVPVGEGRLLYCDGAGDNIFVLGADRMSIEDDSATSRNIVIADEERMIRFTNAAAIAATLPSNATEAIPIGAKGEVMREGAGDVTLVAGGGATVRAPDGAVTSAQYEAMRWLKVAVDTFLVTKQ